jgi:hypothetical protein
MLLPLIDSEKTLFYNFFSLSAHRTRDEIRQQTALAT